MFISIVSILTVDHRVVLTSVKLALTGATMEMLSINGNIYECSKNYNTVLLCHETNKTHKPNRTTKQNPTLTHTNQKQKGKKRPRKRIPESSPTVLECQ